VPSLHEVPISCIDIGFQNINEKHDIYLRLTECMDNINNRFEIRKDSSACTSFCDEHFQAEYSFPWQTPLPSPCIQHNIAKFKHTYHSADYFFPFTAGKFFDTSSLLLIPFNKASRVQDFTNIFPNLNDFLEGPESSCRKTFRK
jgi:hypothetical protein